MNPHGNKNCSIPGALKKLVAVAILSFTAESSLFLQSAWSQNNQNTPPPPPPVEREVVSPTSGARNFYTVLDEVLSDFEFDLKSGQVLGMKDISIRNVVVSENVPSSFKSHLELLIAERMLKGAKTRIVNCVACRARKATLNNGNVVISSTENNSTELQRIAKMNGIQNFMDVAYAYQPAGMMLSFQITDAETGTMLWSKNYNSETTRAAAQRRGVDFTAIEEAKTKMEYTSLIQTRPNIYFVFLPLANTSGYTTGLGFNYRMMERYDNRKKEVGFQLEYDMDIGTIVKTTSVANPNNLWLGFNVTMLFTHGWGLFGEEENFNKPRALIYAAIGGTYTSGFLGGVIRGSYEVRMAKHWSIDAFLGYRPSATLVIGSSTATLSGVDGGIGVGYLF